MKNNMENLTITKEKVLEAASKCSTAKNILETMFPEVFESEDKNAFPYTTQVQQEQVRQMFNNIFKEDNLLQIMTASTPSNRRDLDGRALLVLDGYEVLTGTAEGGKTYIEIRKK